MNTDALNHTARRMVTRRLSRRTALTVSAAGLGATMLGRAGRTRVTLAQEATPAATPVTSSNLPPAVEVALLPGIVSTIAQDVNSFEPVPYVVARESVASQTQAR